MKKSAFAAIFAIATMVLSSLATPCRVLPKECRDAGIEGKAYIVFVVKKNGKIDEIEIARSTGNELLDKEALRVVKKMPKWKPGMHEGKKVNILFALPITFKLR